MALGYSPTTPSPRSPTKQPNHTAHHQATTRPPPHNAPITTTRDTPHMSTATRSLHQMGQSIWLDNITRDLLDSGTLARYMAQMHVTGLTSNPTIFEHAIVNGTSYNARIKALQGQGLTTEDLFFELALQDLGEAADLFMPAYEASQGADGWVSIEVSPTLAHDAGATIAAATKLRAQLLGANTPNVFVKIPGTPAGLEAIEQVVFDGVPVNVTLLFSCEQVMAAAHAYMRGLERRLLAGLDLRVASVLSLFVSRWDVAVAPMVRPYLHNRLGKAVAKHAYQAHCHLCSSERWLHLLREGANTQRMLWASTGTKDDKASDTLYPDALGAPGTINTLPEATLLAFAEHGHVQRPMPTDGGDALAVMALFRHDGVDLDALALRLQHEGVDGFTRSWNHLLNSIANKCG
jgi:transaldolase